jgi:hypothetical protein
MNKPRRFATLTRFFTFLGAFALVHPVVASPQQANPSGAVDVVTEVAQGLVQVGEAKLRVMLWDVYRSALYTPTGQYEEGLKPLQLRITYLRDIKAQQLVQQTAKEWRAQGVEHPNMTDWLAQLEALWPNVADGDTLILTVTEGGQSYFSFNERSLGEISDPDFGDLFAGIWLSPKTTRPELRAELIGEQS